MKVTINEDFIKITKPKYLLIINSEIVLFIVKGEMIKTFFQTAF